MPRQKLLLRAMVDRLGDAGDVVEVSRGFARNFLLAKNLAVPATPQILQRAGKDAARREKTAAGRLAEAQKLAERLKEMTLTVHAKAGGDGKLFGSVSQREIVRGLADQGVAVSEQQVLLEGPLKEVGVHTVDLRLHPQLQASVRVWVVEK